MKTTPPASQSQPPPQAHTCAKQDCLCTMTLRDWFAGQALSNASLCEELGPGSALGNARVAYQNADAMLFMREEITC